MIGQAGRISRAGSAQGIRGTGPSQAARSTQCPEIGNQVRTFGLVGHSGKGHPRAAYEGLRIGKKGVERRLVPDNLCGSQRAAITEVLTRSGRAADNANQCWAKFGAHWPGTMAWCACLVVRLAARQVLSKGVAANQQI